MLGNVMYLELSHGDVSMQPFVFWIVRAVPNRLSQCQPPVLTNGKMVCKTLVFPCQKVAQASYWSSTQLANSSDPTSPLWYWIGAVARLFSL